MAADPAQYSAWGLTAALAAVGERLGGALAVDHVASLDASALDVTTHNVVFLPKLLASADYSKLAMLMVDFMYGGGTVVLGPPGQFANVTGALLTQLLSLTSSKGIAGVAVSVDCGPGATSLRSAPLRSAGWADGDVPVPATAAWPAALAAPLAADDPVVADAVTCTPLTGTGGEPVYGRVLYEHPTFAGAAVAAEWRRVGGRVPCPGRAYYLGVDWDAAPLEGSWLALLEAVVLQAANTTQSFSNAAPPPPPSAPPSPPDPWLSTAPPPPPSPSPSPNATSTPPTTSASHELVPWARGRISFTAAGPTSTSGYAAPAPVTTPRRTLLCHDLPVDNANGGGGSGVNSSSGGEGVWLVFDLGTPRRVRSVRVQLLGAFNIEGVPLRGLDDVEVQVRVGLVPAGSGSAGGAPLLGNPRLCPAGRWLLPPNLPTDPTMGAAALAVGCGAEGELVGRHVSVHLLTPLVAARVQLCGVDVVGPAPAGLALASRGKPVCVSPTPLTFELPAGVHPSLAVDGLYGDNRFGSAGTCGLSVLRADPFMSLDLGGPMVVERVEVTKSALPSLGPELASFSLLVTNLSCADAENPLTNTGLPPGSFALCGAGLDLEPGSTGVYGCGGAVGRYVVLATKGYTGYLRVCELDVWVALPSSPSPSAPGTPLRLYPVALARPVAVQGDSPVTPKAGQADFSNTTSVAGLLVDGDTASSLRRGASLGGGDPSELDLSAACVAPSPSTVASPWMAVDLGGTYLVQYVQVHHLYQYDNLPFSALPPLELRLGASAPEPSAAQPPGDPACAGGAGLWAGLEGALDVYGAGANVRRYLCNLSGRFLTLAALRPAAAGGQELAMSPVCELEAWGAAVDGTTPGYLSSRGRYALVSAADGAPLPATARTATRALRDATPKPGVVAAFAQRCAVAEASAASRRAVWAVDLGAAVNVTRIEILGVVPSKLLQRVDVRLLTSDSDLDPAAPPAAGAGALFPGGGNLTLSSSEVTRLLLPSAGEGVGAMPARHVVVANSVADAQLVLCQVWVYTAEPAGAGSSGGGSGEGATAGPGIRPGVGVARAQGRVAASVGAMALEDSLSAMFGQFLSAPRRHHRLLAQQAQGSLRTGAQGRRLLQNPTPPPPVPPTPGPPGSGLLGPASLVLDLGGPRAVEVAVLATQLVSNVYGELTSVVISVSNSSSGAPGPYCVYDATLVLTLSRHLYGCGGAVGRFVVARRTEALGLPPDTTLEALLTDPGTLVSVAALRPTNQSGGAVTGPGGSANAVNGYYSAAAVTAAVSAGLGDSLLTGSATPAVASPWWLVDLGAALPLAWIEITAHPNPDDGLDLVGLEISICNFTVIKGDEGVVLYGNQTLATGATGRFALGGAVARQVVVRQPGVNRSLQLAQVDVWAPRDALSASVVDLLGPRKPLAFPAVYDAFRTLGTFTDASGTSRFDALAPLTADASAATSASRCAALGPGPSTHSPWLLLDLGADQQVARLELLAAADALPASSLSGAEVLLGGNGTDPEANPVVLSGLPSPAPGSWASYALPARPSGRYLVVRVPVGGAAMTLCEVNAYGPSAAELALLPAPSPPPPPPSPLPPAPLDPAPSPPAPSAPPGGAPVNGETIPRPPPVSPLSSPFPPTNSSSNSTAAPPGPPATPASPPLPTPPLAPPPPATPIAAKEQTAPEETTDAVHTDPTAITIVTATVVGATVAATVAATMAASAATSVAGAAAASVGGGTAGSAATLAFVCHLQFFALTSNAAANLSSGYNQTNNGLSWLNLQFDTLGGFGLDLPDAQVQAYSQVVNVFIAYAAVLLLHALLVLALYGTRAWAARRALRRWRRRQGSTASASAVAEATEPSTTADNPDSNNTKHPSFIARTTSSGPEPPYPSSSKSKAWQPHMPVLLVFPHPEIFVFLFFVVALAQAAGTLLASGAEQRAAGEGAHRVVPAIAVGSFLLLLLAAAAAAAVALGLRLFRSAGALGLRYVPEPPEPPPAGERESRVRRWIRITERGYWERPEGPEVALLEPTRTERHLAAPFSLGAALAATQAQPGAHAGPPGPGPHDGDGRNTLYDHMRPSAAGNGPASAPDPEGNGMPAAGVTPPPQLRVVSADKSGHTALAAAAAGTAGAASSRSRGSSLNGAASAWATPGGAAATAAVGAVSGRSRGVSANGAASRPPSAVPSRPISAASLLLGGLRRATTTGDGGASGPDRTGPGTGAGTRSGPMRISDNPLALGGSADSTPAGTPRAAAAAAAAAAPAGLMQPNAPPALLHAIASLDHTASSAIAAGGAGTALQQGRIGAGGGWAGVAVQDSYDAAPPTPSGGRLVAGTPSRGDLRPSAGRSPLAGRLSASGGSSTLLPPPPVPPPPPPAAPPPPEVPQRPQSALAAALGARPSRRTLAPQGSGPLPSLAAATAVDAAAAAATVAEPAEPPEAAAVVGMAAPGTRQGSMTGRQASASGAPLAGSRQGSLSGGPVTWTPSARPPPGPGPGPGPGPAGPDAGLGLPPISSSGGAAAGVAAGFRSRPRSGRDRPSASRPVSGIREVLNGRASGDGADVDAGATAAAGGGGGLPGGSSARWASSRPASANSIGLGAAPATAAAASAAAAGAGPVSTPAAAAAGRASPAASTRSTDSESTLGGTIKPQPGPSSPTSDDPPSTAHADSQSRNGKPPHATFMNRAEAGSVLRAGACPPEEALPPEAVSERLRPLEVYERYGQLFEEMRGTRLQAVAFQGALLFNSVVPSVLIGIQLGGNMQPHSAGARGSNMALLACKAVFAAYATLVMPYSNAVTQAAEVGCAWLEAGVCGCLVGLQWREGVGFSDAMMACEAVVLAIQILRVQLTTIIPTLLLLRAWWRSPERRRGGCCGCCAPLHPHRS